MIPCKVSLALNKDFILVIMSIKKIFVLGQSLIHGCEPGKNE